MQGGHPSRNAISWVDGDKETGLVERFNVTGLPDLSAIRSSMPIVFECNLMIMSGYPTLIQYELGEQEEYTVIINNPKLQVKRMVTNLNAAWGEFYFLQGVPVLYANGPAIAAYVKLAGESIFTRLLRKFLVRCQ